MTDWRLLEVDRLDQHLLESLFDNRIAAIRVPNFFDENTMRAAVRGIRAHGLDYYRDVDPPIGRIGITQYEHRHDELSMKEYFESAPDANRARREMFAGTGDLLETTLNRIGTAWGSGVEIAREPDGREYFAGLVRVIGEALLHCDWARHDAAGWAIAEIDAQITWNVHCSMPGAGGATVVYDRPWDEGAEEFLVDGSYGYRDGLVAGVRSVRVEPRQADLVCFNSRNFHRVERGSGDAERISLSSFIGRTANRQLIAWS